VKIAFDAKRALFNATGLGNYSRYVVNNLSARYPENDYLLYTPGKGRMAAHVTLSPSISFRYPTGFPMTWVPSLWRLYGIPNALRREKVDIFHGLSNQLPLNMESSDIPSIVTMHDLIFLRYPHFYHFIDRKGYAYKCRQACRQANHIIAVSEMTRRDVCSFFHIPEEKVEVIYQGCDAAFSRTVMPEYLQSLRKKYALDAPFILFVGSMEARKNLLIVLRALETVREDIHLVAVGRWTPYVKQIQAWIRSHSKLASRVHLLHHVDSSELPAFYRSAELFVYPSFFEGFGIPVLEALVSDTPVIAATGSCLEEAGGSGSLYTDPNDADELASLIHSVLSQPQLSTAMRKAGREHAARFDSNRLTHQMLSLYKRFL
jgi:glycosyltransferase involved in cell wall biosynthesis